VIRPELLKRLDVLFEKAEKEGTFGCIEIELRGGCATVIRETKTSRLQNDDEYKDREKAHAKNNYR
jgi:hypothetical protein